MNPLQYRKAEPQEMDWAYRLFKAVMQQYISDTWGWNELFQRHSFEAHIPASGFLIASTDNADIGGYSIQQKPDHLHLEMLLIEPQWQNQGYGTVIMQRLQAQSRQLQLPLRLSVLKNNPAFSFYQTLGFRIENEDSYRYRLVFQPEAEIL